MPRTVTRSVVLDAPAEPVWAAVKTPAAFRFVSRGLVRIVGLAARESPWREGETVRGLLLIFDLLPVSIHHLTVVRIDEGRRELHSDERGGMIHRWRHIIRVTPIDAVRCRYEDSVEIDAGWMTGIVVAFADWFYGLRQRRWQVLARSLAMPRT